MRFFFSVSPSFSFAFALWINFSGFFGLSVDKKWKSQIKTRNFSFSVFFWRFGLRFCYHFDVALLSWRDTVEQRLSAEVSPAILVIKALKLNESIKKSRQTDEAMTNPKNRHQTKAFFSISDFNWWQFDFVTSFHSLNNDVQVPSIGVNKVCFRCLRHVSRFFLLSFPSSSRQTTNHASVDGAATLLTKIQYLWWYLWSAAGPS